MVTCIVYGDDVVSRLSHRSLTALALAALARGQPPPTAPGPIAVECTASPTPELWHCIPPLPPLARRYYRLGAATPTSLGGRLSHIGGASPTLRALSHCVRAVRPVEPRTVHSAQWSRALHNGAHVQCATRRASHCLLALKAASLSEVSFLFRHYLLTTLALLD